MTLKKQLLPAALFAFYALGVTSCFNRDFIEPKPMEVVSTVRHKTQNLVVITLDGVRWQEIFRGADSSLLYNPLDVKKDISWLNSTFWADDVHTRRRKLAPFFWNEVVSKGVLYGNRDFGSKVSVTNPYKISYPGYSELFTGYADPNISANDYGPNPNYNVFEFFLHQPEFQPTDIAAFSEWDAFTNILNEKRNGLNLFAGAKDGESVDKIMQDSSTSAVRGELASFDLYSATDLPDTYDRRVYIAAKAYAVKYHPKVLYIAFGAADTYGHWRQYDSYLENIYNVDRMIEDLWQYYQSDPDYKDKTTFFITTDHGRGEGALWTDHGPGISHSEEMWIAALGPDTKPQGEIKLQSQFYQKQVARSLAAFLGYGVEGTRIMGKRIRQLMNDD